MFLRVYIEVVMIFAVLCFVFMKHTQFISTVLDLKYFAVLKKSENILFEFYYNVGFHQFQKNGTHSTITFSIMP